MSNVGKGRRGEALAAHALVVRGYEIAARNWRSEAGEIDLIARKDGVWVFVEVKLRSGDAFGGPEAAITEQRQRRLLDGGLLYLAEHGLDDAAWRIDVVTIRLAESGRVHRLDIYEDAVRSDG